MIFDSNEAKKQTNTVFSKNFDHIIECISNLIKEASNCGYSQLKLEWISINGYMVEYNRIGDDNLKLIADEFKKAGYSFDLFFNYAMITW